MACWREWHTFTIEMTEPLRRVLEVLESRLSREAAVRLLQIVNTVSL